KWEWGNSGDPNIYLDTQTRSQSLSFRGNMARLTETLIAENKIEKAKDVIDIAMENMPVEGFGYYAFVEPFVDGYYKVGETQKARDLFQTLKKKYQERLDYYAGIPLDQQYTKLDDILDAMQGYRRNIDILVDNKDQEIAEKETLIFNEYIDKFSHFYKKEDLDHSDIPPMPESNPDVMDSIVLDNTKTEEALDSTGPVPVN